WARADGSDLHTLAAGFWDVRDLLWLPDSEGGQKRLAYVVLGGEGNHVEILDLVTQGRLTLAEKLRDVSRLDYFADSKLVAFWQRDASGAVSRTSYELGGQLAYRAVVDGSLNGNELFPSPYRSLLFQEVYPAPDRQVFAIKLGLD